MKKIVLKKFVLCILLLCVLPGISFATTSGPFTTTTPITLTATDWTNSLSFPQFDSGLGILNSVTIDLSGSLSTVLTVTNNSPNGSSSGAAMTMLQMTVQDSGSNLNAPTIDMSSPLYSYSLGAGGSVTSGTLTMNGISSDTYTLAAVIAEFTGPGTILLDASTFTQTGLFNTGGNTFASQLTDASLTGTVTYDYTVPEPATMSLMSIGGLALLRKRRK
jgi:PEP-CTERM motif-containing protein